MERFIKGDVVVIPFPFSNLSQTKRRPALVLSVLHGEDMILCQITSKDVGDVYTVTLLDGDFESGSLRQASNIRPNRLFTADINIVLYKVGHIKAIKIKEVLEIVKDLFQ